MVGSTHSPSTDLSPVNSVKERAHQKQRFHANGVNTHIDQLGRGVGLKDEVEGGEWKAHSGEEVAPSSQKGLLGGCSTRLRIHRTSMKITN